MAATVAVSAPYTTPRDATAPGTRPRARDAQVPPPWRLAGQVPRCRREGRAAYPSARRCPPGRQGPRSVALRPCPAGGKRAVAARPPEAASEPLAVPRWRRGVEIVANQGLHHPPGDLGVRLIFPHQAFEGGCRRCPRPARFADPNLVPVGLGGPPWRRPR